MTRVSGCSALLLAATLACGGERAGEPAERVARPAFPGARAFELVEAQLAFGPRVPGTAGHAAQLEWMVEQLAAHADTVVVDRFRHATTAGDTLPLANVLARFNVADPDRLLFLAHWDTRPISDQSPNPEDRDTPVPGANDGASGVAVLMALAELFSLQPPPVGVDLLLVDGEDTAPPRRTCFIGSDRTPRSPWAASNAMRSSSTWSLTTIPASPWKATPPATLPASCNASGGSRATWATAASSR